MKNNKPRKMRNWVAVHAINRKAGPHKDQFNKLKKPTKQELKEEYEEELEYDE